MKSKTQTALLVISVVGATAFEYAYQITGSQQSHIVFHPRDESDSGKVRVKLSSEHKRASFGREIECMPVADRCYS